MAIPTTRLTLLDKVINRRSDEVWEEFVFYYEDYIKILLVSFRYHSSFHDDIIQETLIKLWKSIDKFNQDKGIYFRAWLCKVTSNVAKDYYRKRERENKIEKDQIFLQEELERCIAFPLAEMEALAEQKWRRYIVSLAMKKLSKRVSRKMYQVFMATQANLSPVKIAEEYDIPVNTVYIYINRMEKKLREEISQLLIKLGSTSG